MKEGKSIWKYLLIIAIGLIIVNLIAYGTYWYLPTFEYGFFDFLSELFNRCFILFVRLIPTLILGFVLSKIKYLKNKGVTFKNGLIISAIFIYSLTLISPLGYLISNPKIKVETDNSIVNDVVIYDTKDVKFYFTKSDIDQFCKKKLRTYPDLEFIRSFKAFVDSSESDLIIKKEYTFLPDTFNLIERFGERGKFDTLRVLDRSAKIDSYIEAIDYAMTELIQKHNFRIYDNDKEIFVDYIYVQSVSDKYGNLDLYCYLPDGRRFVDRRLLWGL